MKVQPRDAERFCAKPPEEVFAILLYGPDRGLVRERAQRLARGVVPDAKDPFRIAELEAEELASDPARLRDEAQALSFGGGRRLVTVRGAGDSLGKLFQDFLKEPPGDALILVEAGDLGPRALRKAFEGAKLGAAVACYRDEGESLVNLVRQHLQAAGLQVAPDALAYLGQRLGGDRRLTRLELDKLVLYKGPPGANSGEAPRIELEDAIAVVGDSAERTLDDLALAIGSGDLTAALRDLTRAWAEGAQPITLLRALARHFQRLHLLAGEIARGTTAGDAVKRLRPPIFWKHQAAIAAQARAWPADRLGWALGRLLEAEAACKRSGAPAQLLAERALLELTARAPKRR
ncbi:MAG: DNA polymerase III subunit delta [Rhodospirillales bacterium]